MWRLKSSLYFRQTQTVRLYIAFRVKKWETCFRWHTTVINQGRLNVIWPRHHLSSPPSQLAHQWIAPLNYVRSDSSAHLLWSRKCAFSSQVLLFEQLRSCRAPCWGARVGGICAALSSSLHKLGGSPGHLWTRVAPHWNVCSCAVSEKGESVEITHITCWCLSKW